MATLGSLSLWLALLGSIFTAVAFALSAKSHSDGLRNSARAGLIAVAGLLTVSVLILSWAIFTHNFQFEYVANETSINMSPLFLFSALWAGNAGSLLFWAWILSLISFVVILRKWNKYWTLIPYAGMVLMIVQFFFTFLLVAKLSPFNQLSSVPLDGGGMNLMLQNVGMVFHPPALLAGYVIFAVPFAFAVSTLLMRDNSEGWLMATRRYVLLAWLLLGVGNIIGAWWAYVELGWGGYWAWDPVENAGLMPWLLATAFLHSSVMQRRKGNFKIWNLILIILTFSLVIFGTFLTRSGILNSLHTFTDTGMTPYFMTFIAVALFAPLVLLYTRYDQFRGETTSESFFSREGTFILNNIFLVGATVVVLLGTIFPSISEAVKGTKMALDTSFFNKVNGPLFLAIVILAGVCTSYAGKQDNLKRILRKILFGLMIADAVLLLGSIVNILGVGTLSFWDTVGRPIGIIAIVVCVFVVLTIITEWFRDSLARHKGTGENYFTSWWHLVWSNGQRYGGYTVHLGIILMAVGVIGSSFYGASKEATLKVGESISINQYVLVYKGLTSSDTPDITTVDAQMAVYKGNKLVDNLVSQKQFQKSSTQPVTNVAIRYGLSEDVYVILESWQNNGASADFKVLVNPLVDWIWIGGIVFLIGGLVTFWPGRRTKLAYLATGVEEKEVTKTLDRNEDSVNPKIVDDEIERLILNKRKKADKSTQDIEPIISKERTQSGVFCAKCGTRNIPGAKFCSQCGAKNMPDADLCSQCGTRNKPGARFCSQCGKNLTQGRKNA